MNKKTKASALFLSVLLFTALGTSTALAGYGRGACGNYFDANDNGVCDYLETTPGVVTPANPDERTTPSDSSEYGAKGALADENLTQEEMLTYAIQDEYLARAEYAIIIAEYGRIRPFTNIIRAENAHIRRLEALFTAYGYATPQDTAIDLITVPATLAGCYLAGVTAEIENIAMYNRFLDEDLPADIELAFTALRNASENHLRAFQMKA